MSNSQDKLSTFDNLERVLFLNNIPCKDDSIEKVLKSAQGALKILASRHEALYSMSKIYYYLDHLTFIESCPQFIDSCISVLDSKSSSSEKVQAYKLFIELIVRIYQLNAQELIRDLSKSISKFLQQSTHNVPLNEMILFSKLLEACTKVFPSSITGKKTMFETKYFTTIFELSKNDFDTIKPHLETLSIGYVKVLLTGNFRNENRFIESLSKLLSIFEGFLSIFKVFKMQVPILNFKFPSDYKSEDFFNPLKDNIKDSFVNIKKLYFITCSIKNILQESLPIKMEIPVSAILTLFQAFTNLFKYQYQNERSLSFIVSELFQNIYGILEILMKIGKKNMIIFTRDVNILIRSSIDWLNKSSPKMYLKLRSAFNAFLNAYFISLTINHNLDDDDLKNIVLFVLKNIGIYDTSLKIQLTNMGGSKDADFAFDNEAFEDKRLLVQCTDLSIQVLNTILNCEILLINDKKHLELYNEVIRVVIRSMFEIYNNWITLPYPFQCSNCRAGMLECFYLAITNAPTTVSPPLEIGIAFLQLATRLEKCPKIRALIFSYQKTFERIMDSKLYQQGVSLPIRTVLPDIFQPEMFSVSIQTDESLTNIPNIPTSIKKIQQNENDIEQKISPGKKRSVAEMNETLIEQIIIDDDDDDDQEEDIIDSGVYFDQKMA